MRIRSIKPEFWRSATIASLPWNARLVFIGLWSYVDDNGVGLDNYKLIAADLFGMDEDTREGRDNTRDSLASVADAGLIIRYTVAGKRYLRVTNWDEHQRIDRPGKNRYPLPDVEGAIILDPSHAAEMDCGTRSMEPDSRDPRESVASVQRLEKGRRGEGEQGNRGEEEQEGLFASLTDLATAEAATDSETKTETPKRRRKQTPKPVSPATPEQFAEAWDIWPRPDKKQAAVESFDKARFLVEQEDLLAAMRAYLAYERARGTDDKFIPYFSTWLNQKRWNDPISRPDRPGNVVALHGDRGTRPPMRSTTDERVSGWLDIAAAARGASS